VWQRKPSEGAVISHVKKAHVKCATACLGKHRQERQYGLPAGISMVCAGRGSSVFVRDHSLAPRLPLRPVLEEKFRSRAPKISV